MKLAPMSKVGGFIGRRQRDLAAGLISGLLVGVMIRDETMRAEVVLGGIEEFAADLNGSEIEKMPDGSDLNFR